MTPNLDSILKNVDPLSTLTSLQALNPREMLKQLGAPEEKIPDILEGDMSSISKPKLDDILDYITIEKNYGKHFNVHLIKYFFKKAKEGDDYTEREIEIYSEAYNAWFNLIFKVGRAFVFGTDMGDLNSIIRYNGEYYQLIRVNELNLIVYLGVKHGRDS